MQAAQPLALAPADPCQPPSVIERPVPVDCRCSALTSSPGAVLIEHDPALSWSVEFTAKAPWYSQQPCVPECVCGGDGYDDVPAWMYECSVAAAKSILTGPRCPVPHMYLHMTYVNHLLLAGQLRGLHILTRVCQSRASWGPSFSRAPSGFVLTTLLDIID